VVDSALIEPGPLEVGSANADPPSSDRARLWRGEDGECGRKRKGHGAEGIEIKSEDRKLISENRWQKRRQSYSLLVNRLERIEGVKVE